MKVLMASTWQESTSSSDKKRLIRELLRGRESAIQLQSLLSKASGDNKAVLMDEMLGKIQRSFSESMSFMGSFESPKASDVMSGDSHESQKRPGSKEGRGCYKRRRGSQLRTMVVSKTEDGYAWRKYGQKDILNSKFPRCYYRCTHKHDQGCKATKQVQKTDDDPSKYQITYLGQHTCTEIMRAPQMIPDSDPWESVVPATRHESNRQSFPRDNGTYDPFSCVKDELKEDSGSDLTDSVSWFPDLPGFGSSAEPTTYFSLWSDDGVRSFPDADFTSRYINFDGDSQFAGSELLWRNFEP